MRERGWTWAVSAVSRVGWHAWVRSLVNCVRILRFSCVTAWLGLLCVAWCVGCGHHREDDRVAHEERSGLLCGVGIRACPVVVSGWWDGRLLGFEVGCEGWPDVGGDIGSSLLLRIPGSSARLTRNSCCCCCCCCLRHGGACTPTRDFALK